MCKGNTIFFSLMCCTEEVVLATKYINPNWHEQGTFTPLVILGLDLVCWISIKNFQSFLEVKIDINWVNLTPCQAHWVLQNLLLGVAKDEHFSCFLSSCQLGLRANITIHCIVDYFLQFNTILVSYEPLILRFKYLPSVK